MNKFQIISAPEHSKVTMGGTTVSLILVFVMVLVEHCFGAEIENSMNTLVNELLTPILQSTEKVIAVFPFESSIEEDRDIGKAVAEYVVAAAKNHPNVRIVDRISFRRTLDELALSQTGLFEDDQALQIGRMVSARYFIAGTVSNAFGKRIVNARLVKIETAEVVSTSTLTIENKQLDNLAHEILSEKGDVKSSLFRSMVAPGWGQFYSGKNVRGVLSASIFLSSVGFTIYSGTTAGNARGEYQNYHNYMWTEEMIADRDRQVAATGNSVAEVNAIYEQREDDLYSDYSRRSSILQFSAVITSAVWTANLIDAAFAGTQAKRKYDLYFSSSVSHYGLTLCVRF